MPTAETVTQPEIVRAIINVVGLFINGSLFVWAIADLMWALLNKQTPGRLAVAMWHAGTETGRVGVQLVLAYEAWLQLITPGPTLSTPLQRQGDLLVNAALVLVMGAGVWAMFWRGVVLRYIQPTIQPDEATVALVEAVEMKHHSTE